MMKFVTTFLSVVFSAFLLVACNPSGTTNTKLINDINTEIFKNNPGINIEVVKFNTGYYGNYYEDQNIVIKSKDEFKRFWEKLFQTLKPIPKLPSVDFSKKMLLFTIRETKSTGGYTTQISKVVKTNNALAVKISNTNPGDSCGRTQALSTPFQIVKVDKLDLPINFYEKTTVQPCGT